MRAYRGIIQDGVVVLEEGVKLPEGAVVTVTVGETEILRATLRNALSPKAKERKVKIKLKPVPSP